MIAGLVPPEFLVFLLPRVKEDRAWSSNAIFDRNVVTLIFQFITTVTPRRTIRECELSSESCLTAGYGGLAFHPNLDRIFVAATWKNAVDIFDRKGENTRDGEEFVFNPRAVAIHPLRDEIFVTGGKTAGVHCIDRNGAVWDSWGHFKSACGIAVHPTHDLVYVVDQDDHCIKVFSLTGRFLGHWGSSGKTPGQFHSPLGIAVHPHRDLVFVSETGTHPRIQVLRGNGVHLYQWSMSGCFPRHVALDPLRDLLYVADSVQRKILVFSLTGWKVDEWQEDDSSHPWGIAVSGDTLYVSDSKRNRVRAYDLKLS